MNACCLCAIPLFFVVLIAMVVVILTSHTFITIGTTVSECEQVLACPSSLKGNSINFTTHGSDATAYLVSSLPKILPDSTETIVKVDEKFVLSGDYLMHSFNLVQGSNLTWNISASNYFDFYLIEGEEEYNKFDQYEEFHYIYRDYHKRNTQHSISASSSNEYFAVIDVYGSSLTVQAHNYSVFHKRYDLTKFVKSSSKSLIFDVDGKSVPGACLIVDMPCGKNSDADIWVTYELDHDTLFYVCLVIAILFGVAGVVSIIVCVVAVFWKKKGTQGNTYQNVPSSSTATPAVPAGNQPPPAIYNTVAPPTAYAAGAPPAAPATYNTATAPATYNTAPAPVSYSTPNAPGVYSEATAPGVYSEATPVYNTGATGTATYGTGTVNY